MSQVTISQIAPRKSGLAFNVLPHDYQQAFDTMAAELLDPERGKLAVVSEPSQGKSNLIRWFLDYKKRYLEMADADDIVVVKVSRENAQNIIEEGSFDSFAWSTSQVIDPSKKIIFLTGNYQVAMLAADAMCEPAVIFETNTHLFNSLFDSDSRGADGNWSSWGTIQLETIVVNEAEMMKLLNTVAKNAVSDRVRVEKFFNKMLMNRLAETVQEIEINDGDTVRTVYPLSFGFVAQIHRRAASFMSMSKDISDKGSNEPEAAGIAINAAVKGMERDIASRVSSFKRFHAQPGTNENVQRRRGNAPRPGNNVRAGVASAPVPRPTPSPAPQTTGVNEESFCFKRADEFAEIVNSQVFGQSDAVNAVCEGLLIPSVGFNDESRPLRSMLFLGPTGVGKTRVAQLIAEQFGNQAMNIIRLDMGEYSSEHQATKLFGAPPGYIGSDRGGILTTAVMENPRSVIIFDEVEKAHPKVWDSVLQVLDAGRMTSGQGDVADFTKTIIIMTSNIGAEAGKKSKAGFSSFSSNRLDGDEARAIANTALREYFRPEFLGRINDVVHFSQISREAAHRIVRREVSVLTDRIAAAGFTVEGLSNDILDVILDHAEFESYGARQIQTAVAKHIATPVARSIQSAGVKHMVMSVSDGAISVNPANPALTAS